MGGHPHRDVFQLSIDFRISRTSSASCGVALLIARSAVTIAPVRSPCRACSRAFRKSNALTSEYYNEVQLAVTGKKTAAQAMANVQAKVQPDLDAALASLKQ